MEMRDERLSSVGAQDVDTSSYQVSDLEDIEFFSKLFSKSALQKYFFLENHGF